jgi:hypothetical protein
MGEIIAKNAQKTETTSEFLKQYKSEIKERYKQNSQPRSDEMRPEFVKFLNRMGTLIDFQKDAKSKISKQWIDEIYNSRDKTKGICPSLHFSPKFK